MKRFDGLNLRKIRVSRGYSMERLTLLLEVRLGRKLSKSSVYQWETGRSRPSLDALIALSEVFQDSIDSFFAAKSNYQFVLNSLIKATKEPEEQGGGEEGSGDGSRPAGAKAEEADHVVV